VALPLNDAFSQDQIFFSTDDAKAAALATGGTVSFEIDRVEEGLREGWSVLVTGACRRVDDAEEVRRLAYFTSRPGPGGTGTRSWRLRRRSRRDG
jgi:hypothetical protein